MYTKAGQIVENKNQVSYSKKKNTDKTEKAVMNPMKIKQSQIGKQIDSCKKKDRWIDRQIDGRLTDKQIIQIVDD